MVTINGTTAKRVARPSSSRPPQTNSALDASRRMRQSERGEVVGDLL
jgi:hypothetical protein